MTRSFNIILFFSVLLISCNGSPEKENSSLQHNQATIQKPILKDSLLEFPDIDTISIDNNHELENSDKGEVVFLSETCQQFIDDYKRLISDYESILIKMKEDDGNINLIIAKSSLEDELEAMLSDPVNFQCSNSKCIGSSLFLEEMEEINIRKDALY
ncbi:MAG: hypothetical protein P8L23_02415 [Flavobacteriales bacterium]|nr:hypothetical protein [Flavobacteriales bacterium]